MGQIGSEACDCMACHYLVDVPGERGGVFRKYNLNGVIVFDEVDGVSKGEV